MSRIYSSPVVWALMYHDVLRPEDDADAIGFPGPLARRYKLTTEHFDRHLAAIGQAAPVGRFADDAGDDRPCLITFDDGGASAMVAADALERRGWRGHFFVTTGRIDTPGFLTAGQVRELRDRGHEIGSHSHNHPTYMGRQRRDVIAQEWRQSREILGDVLGEVPRTASIPGGYLTSIVVVEAAAAGYSALMTSEPTARISQYDGMTVHGRYTIWSTTSPAQAAGYARGAVAPRARLWTEWRLKRLMKQASPAVYQRLRRLRARTA